MPCQGRTVTIRTANETATTPVRWAPLSCRRRLRAHRSRRHRHRIAKEHLGKIFDPFFTTKRWPGNRARPRHRLWHRQADGRLHHVDSDVGKGTVFRIFLPRFRADQSAVQPEPERAQPRDVTGQDTILLVEDEEAVRSFAARALRMRGYNVLEPRRRGRAEMVRTRRRPSTC